MRDRRQVHDFLHALFAKHRATGRPRRHHVLMIAENTQTVRRERPRRHVQYGRQQFARHFIQIRNHQQKALRSRVCRRQRARLQRAVHHARRAAFRLHLDHFHRPTEHIFPPVRRPIIDQLRHRRTRRDRVNPRDFRKAIRNVRRRRVAVHCFPVHVHATLLFSAHLANR